MEKVMTELLKKLMNTAAVSGREQKLADVIEKETAPFCDEILRDRLGSLYAHKKGSGSKVLFCAHMDDIGFFVTNIEDSGVLRIAPAGNFALTGLLYSAMVSERGVRGVLVPDKGSNDFEKCERLHIDIGVDSKRTAEKKISIGDFIVPSASFIRMSAARYMGRPFNGRVGCAVLVDAMKKLADCDNDLYFAFTAHEQVGNRGAFPVGYTVAPEYAIAVDTCTADCGVRLGGGAAIKLKDGALICDSELVERLKHTATEKHIKYQLEISSGGLSDAGAIQKSGFGAIVGGISIPSGNRNCALEIIDLRDVSAASSLVCGIARAL